MKSLAKFFLRLSLVLLPCLTAGCTSEVETIGGIPEKPENPLANDPNRRSVVISLQNKLILVNGTPESRATPRDGIAEEDENRIESFDIYAFGSDKEEGPYTFQERFTYRSEVGTLPVGASPLELKSDEAAGKVNVVFYPRKGLFTKFYCVANQPAMHDAAGHAYTDYTSLQQSSQHQAGTPGDAVIAPGIPTENDFTKLSTPLLEPTGFNVGILLTPLPMSGANSQPVDLREYSMGTFVRLNVSLSRAVARFDVVNDAAKSHFTITDIAMGNGRQGVTLFPIRPTGDVPAAPGQLITYPYRAFDGLNANVGTTTKAFYCYPCKATDEGFLILKGLYAMNLTDEKKEVSYRIPFERVSDGNGARIEINHNHRYTVQITEADPFELTANIRLVDWETGDYIDDYEPENGLDAVIVANLLPVDETTYDVNTSVVTLALKTGSSFTATTGSNAGVEAQLSYYGDNSADGWLKLEEIPITTAHIGATQQVKYKVTLDESYTGDNYPRGILCLKDKAGGGEEVILIDIDATLDVPIVKPTGGAMSPDGINKWDMADNTLYLVQTLGPGASTGKITVTAIGGSKIEIPADAGITVTPASSTNTTQEYTFQWASTDATNLTEKDITVTLKNNTMGMKAGNITVKLLPNRINGLQITNQGEGISLSAITATTATLTMPIIKERQFTLTMDSYSKPTVNKCPSWLENTTPLTTRSAPESKTISFTFKLIEDAANFSDTQIVFTNTAGGTGMTVNITREFQAPVITATGTMEPSVNSLSGNTLHMYRVATGKQSKAQIKVYSLGGSTLTTPGSWCYQRVISAPNNYEKIYEIYWDGNGDQLGATNNSTCYLKNAADDSKQLTATLAQDAARPTFSSDYSCVRFNEATNTWCYFDVMDNANLYGKHDFSFKVYSPAGVNIIGTSSFGDISVTHTGNWTTGAPYDTFRFNISGYSYCLGGKGGSTPIGNIVLRSNQSAYFPDYTLKMINYLPICKGYFARKDNNTGKFWANAGETTETFANLTDSWARNAYSGWRLPTQDEWKAFIGDWSDDEGWHNFPQGISNILTDIIPNEQVKCTTNDPYYRIEFNRPNGQWGRDWDWYQESIKRNVVLISL